MATLDHYFKPVTLTDANASHSRPVAGAAAGGSSAKRLINCQSEESCQTLINIPDLAFKVVHAVSLQLGSATWKGQYTRLGNYAGHDLYVIRLINYCFYVWLQ